jgi:hypothetical protein
MVDGLASADALQVLGLSTLALPAVGLAAGDLLPAGRGDDLDEPAVRAQAQQGFVGFDGDEVLRWAKPTCSAG